jgi:hypothetical protein
MRRFVLLLLIASGLVQWHRMSAPEVEMPEEEATPPVSAAPAPTAVIVHCVVDGTGRFVRRSECLELGGTVDEPIWARSE